MLENLFRQLQIGSGIVLVSFVADCFPVVMILLGLETFMGIVSLLLNLQKIWSFIIVISFFPAFLLLAYVKYML